MAITYPLSLPTVTGIASINLRAKNVVSVSQSPFTLKEQVVSHSGQRWEAEVSLPPMKRAAAEEWISFLISLKGQHGRFLLGDPSATSPRGSAAQTAGTPLVNGASELGDTVNIDGLPVSTTGYLLAGDYIQIGSASAATLHKVLTDTDTDASGQAELDIYPSLRASPANDTAITLSSPKGVFRLATSDTNWSINEAVTYGISFAAFEAIA